MHQQQEALSPVALAQRYAHLRQRPAQQSRLLRGSIVAIAGLLLLVMLWPRQLVFVVFLVFFLVFWLPMLLTRASAKSKVEAELYAQLLGLLKDDTLPLSLTNRVAVLAALPASTQPPLLGLAQARLAKKLAYASPTELAELPRAPLHAWLRDLETPDDLRISLLLALGTLHDHAIRPLAQEIAHLAPTERLHEAALECLKSLESAP
ncbi:hypothetical protein [Armatimonas sp.]|uniref:hypothetical protein n=1 Tax=Armatimonas sp. TaxID=1872638 RepID=UPI00286C3F53|nr:hypothetical protein [Armatimonas sp.]